MTLAKFGVRKLLIFAASLMAMTLLAGVLTVSIAQPALAQQEEEGGEEPGSLAKGWAAAEGFLDGVTGPDFSDDSGSSDSSGDGSGEGSGGNGSDEGSGSSDSGGGGWGSSGMPGMSEEAQSGEFGPWSGLIALLSGLLLFAGGIGIASGIALLATAAGRESRIEVGKKLLEGSALGFFIGTLAIPLYNILTNVVVGL